MKKDFIVPEIKRCDVYLIYEIDNPTYTAALPTDILGKIPTGSIDAIIPKLAKRDIIKLEQALQMYTTLESLDDIAKIERDSAWCGRLTVSYEVFNSRKDAENTLYSYAQRLAEKAAEPIEITTDDVDDEWGSKSKKKGKKVRSKEQKTKPIQQKLTPADSKEIDERAPSEDDLETNIVIEKGIGKNLTASLGNTRIAQASSRKSLIEKLDEWVDKSGKDLRIFHLKKDFIEELDRFGEIIDSWKYYSN